MMKQIFNWTIGSFFRSFGRILCYIVIGGLIALLLSSNGNLRDFKLTDLFGIQRVNASVLTENVKYVETDYLSTRQTSTWTNTDGMFYVIVHPSPNERIYSMGISSADADTRNADYVQISFSAEQPLSADSTNYLNVGRCSQWDCSQYNSSGECSRYYCSSLSPVTSIGSITSYDTTTITNMNFIVTANYAGGWSTCSIEGNSVFCPTLGRQLNSIDFHVNFDTLMDTTFKLSVHRSITEYVFSDKEIVNAINNQTEVISDTNTTSETSEASDFFNDFNETAQDGIKAIVSMPLNIFNALTLGSTQDLCFNLKGKRSCLPSGAILWNKTERTTIHVGNATWTPHPFSNGGGLSEQLTLFKTMFNIVVGGYLAYKMLKSLMRITNDILSPTHDKVEVLDL